jgi:hypothetical protein
MGSYKYNNCIRIRLHLGPAFQSAHTAGVVVTTADNYCHDLWVKFKYQKARYSHLSMKPADLATLIAD